MNAHFQGNPPKHYVQERFQWDMSNPGENYELLFIDGSVFYQEKKPNTGFGLINPISEKVIGKRCLHKLC